MRSLDETLAGLEEELRSVEQALADPDVASDLARLRDLSKRHKELAAGSLYSMVLGMGLYGVMFAVPIFVQDFLHFTAMQSGGLLFPGAIAAAKRILRATAAPQLAGGGLFAPISREGGLLLNNLLLTTACAAVFLGTLYPLFLDLVSGNKVSVGPPFFNTTFVPIAMALFAALCVGPFLGWKRAELWPALRVIHIPNGGLSAARNVGLSHATGSHVAMIAADLQEPPEIIADLEPDARGAYAGMVGYFGFDGAMDTCLAIRTMVGRGNTVSVQAGAGIVADSNPTAEFQETVNKATAMLRAIEMAEMNQ